MQDDSLFVDLEGGMTALVSASASVWPFEARGDRVRLLCTPREPHEGDLVVVRVRPENGWRPVHLQNACGRPVSLYPGDLFVGVMGLRQSTEHVMGALPDHLVGRGDSLSLLSEGGVIGTCVFAPARHGPPPPVEVVGFLELGKAPCNLDVVRPPSMDAVTLPPVILVAGTSTGVGKTTLAGRIIHVLSQMPGQTVGSIMLSGSGGKSDTLAHRAAGARFFHSFIETGLCNSYGCPPDEFVERVDDLVYRMVAHERPTVIVGEMGGDFIFGNNEPLLRQSCLIPATIGLFVVCHDALATLGALRVLESWEIRAPIHPVVSWSQNHAAMRLRFARFIRKEPLDPDNGPMLTRLLDQMIESMLPHQKRLRVAGG